MGNKIAFDIETQDPSPRWNNGRPEMQLRFYEPKDGEKLQIRFLQSKHEFKYPKYLECYFDFADEKQKRLVWSIFQQLGEVSFFMAYRNRKGEDTERTVTPVAMAFKNGFWGFFALCELKNDIRWFRLDRVQNLDPMPLSRPIPPMEISYRLVAMPPHERQAVLDALKVLDPEAHKRCTDEGYRRIDGKQPKRKKAKTNSEGLSWVEWAQAAGVPIKGGGTLEQRDAWKAGEDPHEWRERMTANQEGLTWDEWAYAAGFDPNVETCPENQRRVKDAWQNGEDPTEWRAHLKMSLMEKAQYQVHMKEIQRRASDNERNRKGITFGEWMKAAGLKSFSEQNLKDWYRGVDPEVTVTEPPRQLY